MSLTPGTRLGPYEIKSPLGAGGMGEVYRVLDPRLGREVAVKVLPRHLSASAEARARFEREARTVSALGHPHICTLHDIGREGDIDFLVMELVEGETLAARIARGPLPLADVLRIGRQVADALDRAHRAGVVHRDLKPGNIMLARSGAKLLDFGLARVEGGAGGPGSTATHLPTEVTPLTTAGSILGTFQYMAPEQLEGRPQLDARMDLWALGCVLHEMATGQRAFHGESQASLISAILRDMPPALSAIQPLTPPALERLVLACLAKDPDDRVQSAHDVGLQLGWIAESGPASGAGAAVVGRAPRRPRERLLWSAAVLVVAAVAAWGWLGRSPASDAAGMRRFVIPLPSEIVVQSSVDAALAPDGRHLAFTGTDTSGADQLFIQSLATGSLRVVPRTEGARMPFWSPDGRSVGFFARGQLMTVGIADRDPIVLAEAAAPRGGSWGSKGTILYSPVAAGPLWAVSASGGSARVISTIDSAHGEQGHRLPQFLPDGEHFLFTAVPPKGTQYETWIGSLAGAREGPVLRASAVARWSPTGHLVFARGRTLAAVMFDPRSRQVRGETEPFADIEYAISTLGEPTVSFDASGLATVAEAQPSKVVLEWHDRGGRRLERLPVPPGDYSGVRPSRDGTSAVIAQSVQGEGVNLLLADLTRGTTTPLTTEVGNDLSPQWVEDGRRVLFVTNRDGHYQIVTRSVRGVPDERPVFRSPAYVKFAPSLSADGRWLVFMQDNPVTGTDVMRVDLTRDSVAVPFAATPASEQVPTLHPSGRVLAYVSDESGRPELYFASFPEGTWRRRVSALGSAGGEWVRDGREFIYQGSDGSAWSVSFDPERPEAESGPRRLFELGEGLRLAAAAADGERLLVAVPVQRSTRHQTVFAGWTSALRR
jgi:Tol biopolymer transport system component